MKAEVSVLQTLPPWTKTFHLTPTCSPSSAWNSSPPPLHPPLLLAPSFEKMHPGHPDPDPPLPESQLDFFHKLGYSTAQVQAVQQAFGACTDTDKLLGQLVRIGVQQGQPETTASVLVSKGEPRAGGTTLQLPVSGQTTPRTDEGGEEEDVLRAVVIDGSNVAMSHGNKEVFSCLGIQLAVDFFLDRGHSDVTVFVPSWRKEQPRPDVPITDQHILLDLERRKILVFTPSRRIAGKRVVCNDDCFIVKHGFESDGIIVSNDMYRDLQAQKPEWKRFIEERLLMYSFVNNKFMPPDDPLGRHGPTLQNFLRKNPKTQKKQPCPYGKKCTYGIKCKFHHLERAKQSNRLLADELRENAKQQSMSVPAPGLSLLLVEDMAKKLSLGPESGPAEKEPKSKQSKTRHRKKSSSKKEKSGQQRSVQEQLDSGLGSIDSQPTEAPGTPCDHLYDSQQPLSSPQGAVFNSHALPSGGTTVSFNPRSAGPMSGSSDMFPYAPPHYVDYYPVSLHAYSQPAEPLHHHIHQQPYWSDPYAPPPPSVPSPWQLTRTPPGSIQKEREVVRKKLLAIFSSQLVDTAMNMFPQVMDPQVLVAEILVLQSQNRSLR